jgi:hypothetical protein
MPERTEPPQTTRAPWVEPALREIPAPPPPIFGGSYEDVDGQLIERTERPTTSGEK